MAISLTVSNNHGMPPQTVSNPLWLAAAHHEVPAAPLSKRELALPEGPPSAHVLEMGPPDTA